MIKTVLKTAWEGLTDEDVLKSWADNKYEKDKAGRKRNLRAVETYLKWRVMTAKQALDEQAEYRLTRIVPMKLIEFVKVLHHDLNYSESTSHNMSNAVRSFYKYWGIQLLVQNGDFKSSKPVYSDYDLSLEDIRAIVAASDLRGRAIILTAESTGWREGDIANLKRNQIEEFLDKEPPVQIKTITSKKNIEAISFLHKAAIDALKKYLATRTDDNEYLFVTIQRGIKKIRAAPLNKIIQDSARRAGIETGTYRLRFHCLRKFLIGRLQDAGVEQNVWKIIVGKKTKEKTYSTKKLRDSYIKALPRIDPSALVNNHKKVEDLTALVEGLQEQLASLERAKTAELLMDYYQKYMVQRNDEKLGRPRKLMKLSDDLTNVLGLTEDEMDSMWALAKAMKAVSDKLAYENNHREG